MLLGGCTSARPLTRTAAPVISVAGTLTDAEAARLAVLNNAAFRELAADLGIAEAELFSSGILSLGSLVGFVTVLGVAARNAIMLVSHFRHLETEEGMEFGIPLVVRGAEERLAPILMTALTAGLALLPLVINGDKPGHEIEHPLAVVILGGLVTSTLLNLFLLPTFYAVFGRVKSDPELTPA